MDIKRTTIDGSSEPVTATEVKSYLKIDFTDDDTLIETIISGVREMAEQQTGLSLIPSTIVYFEDSDYDDEIRLPYPEHNDVTEVIQNSEDITADCIITGETEKVVKLPYIYDSITENDYGVKITYTTLGTCPAGVKLALLKAIADIYERRGNTFEGAIAELSENSIAMLTRYMKL